MTNYDEIETEVELKECNSYQEAAQHAESAYWVRPVWCTSEGLNDTFSNHFKVAAHSTGGLVHYERRHRTTRR